MLDELKDHLDDNHLHVIAAPGSGKTVLGLEVLRRLNQPALILAPTVAIRDQWVDRFVNLFMDNGHDVPAWISRDIRSPQFITASTYQGLHSVYRGEDRSGKRQTGGRDALVQRLQHLGVRTLVLDEAHHLRNEWWKCLADLNKQLGKPTVVALTATAPFDVSPFEWDRYIGLCGPIDSEISVPELVAQKNLCPHQDYVYMSAPLQAEQQEIREFRQEVEAFVQKLCADQEFIGGPGKLPLREPAAGVRRRDSGRSAVLFERGGLPQSRPGASAARAAPDPRAFAAKVPKAGHGLAGDPAGGLLLHPCQVLRSPQGSIPSPPARGQTRRRGGSQGRQSQEQHEGRAAPGPQRLQAAQHRGHRSTGERCPGAQSEDGDPHGPYPPGGFPQGRGRRESRSNVSASCRSSSRSGAARGNRSPPGGSLRAQLGDGLLREARQACDERPTIPKAFGLEAATQESDAGGATHVPHTESDTGAVRLGILSGTLTVIPSESCERLQGIAPGLGIEPADINFQPLDHDSRFCEVTIRGADKHKMVALITSLFNQGSITVLIGTTSLLGEGWDAPSVNSLILASFVGSYMLSNQMRGRAIRVQDGNPTKTANIWHLVCQEEDAKQANEDMETLARRFKSFVGVSFTSNRIESGLGRLGLGEPPYTRPRMDHINGVMTQRACDRAQAYHGLGTGARHVPDGDMVEQVAASPLALPRDFIFRNTILALLWQAWFWGVSVFSMLMQSTDRNSQNMSLRGMLILLAIAAAAAALAALPKCLKALWLCLRHGSIASSMKQIGKAVLKAMVQGELIETSLSQLKVVARPLDRGFVGCSLQGGTTRERSIFLDALQEVLGPIENPRYVLVRKSLLGWFLRKDYHTVPTALGRNKDLAEYFRKMWSRHVGPADLVYTRTPEGRRFLLEGPDPFHVPQLPEPGRAAQILAIAFILFPVERLWRKRTGQAASRPGDTGTMRQS